MPTLNKTIILPKEVSAHVVTHENSSHHKCLHVVLTGVAKVSYLLPQDVEGEVIDNRLILRSVKTKQNLRLLGLCKADLVNSILAVTKGFVRNIFLVGVGYKFLSMGDNLTIEVGRSNSYRFTLPPNLKIKILGPQTLSCWSNCLQTLTEFSSRIHHVRPGIKDKYNNKGVWLA